VAPEALAVGERLLSVLTPQEQKTLSPLIEKLTRQARLLAPQDVGEGEA
jgi:hypothetical protein